MRLIIGLGNPGSRFAATRHNLGFRVVDSYAERRSLSFVPGKGDYIAAVLEKDALVLIKPTSYMNDSGVPVRQALEHFQVPAGDALIVFDDIDLPLGALRFRTTGGAGTHKGLASVIYHLGTEDFPRLRLGIATDVPLRPSEKYVLEPFRPQDETLVDEVIERAVEGIDYYLDYGIDQTMTRFNVRPAAAADEKGNIAPE